ncbi:MAG: hypothetical protein HY301_16830 [Verrucomicrobia bacterium]|nr:hypothetical protein [Verrucomicrobiota bacterium]
MLELEGYWIKPSFKVELTNEDKVAIGRPSCPRWELDLVAYKGATNSIRVVECKSYLDSKGVSFADFDAGGPNAERYKLFNEEVLRNVVFGRLATQLTEAGLCAPSPSIELCLAAGRIANEYDLQNLKSLFAQKGWQLLDAEWLRTTLNRVAEGGYQDHVAAIVAKLLLR